MDDMYPFVDFFGNQIPTYGLCVLIAVYLVGVLSFLYAKKVKTAFEDILVVGAGALLAGLLGGWLLSLFVTHSLHDILEMVGKGDYSFLGGGLVFYGALIGGVLGGLLCVRITGAPLVTIERCIVPYIPFGHAIGRLGCILAGCCIGTPYDGFGALYYSNSLFGLDPNQGYFPVQLLEAAALMCIGLYLVWLRGVQKNRLELLLSYFGLYGFVRFLLEFLRGDMVRGFYGGLSTSQWISLGSVCVCIVYFTIVRMKLHIKEKPSQSN